MIMNLQDLRQVTVVMVTHHSAHCLANQNGLLGHCPNIIISDNASNDNTPTLAKALWPHAKVLTHPLNLGFGAANNRALDLVSTPFALLLNPDCAITPEAIVALISAANDMPEAALVAPQLLGAKGKLELNYRWPKTMWSSKGPGANGPTCVGFVCGAAMLFRIDKFASLGFFDETFFLYYEDDDLCLRLFNAHLPVVLVPEVQAVHSSRGSVKGHAPLKSEFIRGYYHAQSKLSFEKKHGTLQAALQQRRRLLASTSLALFFRFLLFSPKRLARMWGRCRGLMEWATQHGH
jgi:N-acetylglucosaminyl-diphospho-decaprenol L-rhamnosyltransferase